MFNNTGDLWLKGLASSSGNPIWFSSKVQVYSPGNYQPSIEFTGEGNKDAFALYHAWSQSYFSAGLRAVDATFVISPGNHLHNLGCFRMRGDGSAVIQTQTGEAPLELGGDNLSRFIRFHDWWDASYTAGYHRGSRKFRICNAWDIEGGQLLEMDNGSITAHRHINATSLTASGNVQAGALRAGYVGAAKLQVRSDWWADRVFGDDYRLRPLSEVAAFIGENGRLPDVPSEAEVRRDGIDAAAMFTIQMTKIEELTLHAIELERQAKAKDAIMAKQEALIAELRLTQQRQTATQQRQAVLIARLASRLGIAGEEP
jgi:hypothetical protein